MTQAALHILRRKFYKNTEKLSLYSQSLLIFIHKNEWTDECCIKARQQLSSYWARLQNNYPFPKWQILDSSKFKAVADDNLNFVEIGRKLFKQVENIVEKEKFLVASNFSFLHSVFKRLVLQTRTQPVT